MSAQGLANECAALGFPIQRSVIANFENGRRTSVTLAEILVFAEALGVSPMELMCPVGKEAEIEPLPGVKMDPYAALLWMAGLTGSLDRRKQPDGLHALPYAAYMMNSLEDFEVLKRKEKSLMEVIERRREEIAQIESESSRKRRAPSFAKQEEQLHAAADEKLKAAESANDLDERMQLLKEAQVFANASLAQAKMSAQVKQLKAELEAREARLSNMQIQIQNIEEYLRSSLGAFKDAGLLLPQLVPELQYLLD